VLQTGTGETARSQDPTGAAKTISVRLIGGRDGQRGHSDVGRGTGGGILQSVISRISAGNVDPRHINGFARAHVAVRTKGRTGGTVGKDVVRNPVVGKSHCGGGRAVVDLVDSCGRDRQRTLVDRQRTGNVRDGVIAGRESPTRRIGRRERICARLVI